MVDQEPILAKRSDFPNWAVNPQTGEFVLSSGVPACVSANRSQRTNACQQVELIVEGTDHNIILPRTKPSLGCRECPFGGDYVAARAEYLSQFPAPTRTIIVDES
jgi:hypothetical protein